MLEVVDITHVQVVVRAICPTHALLLCQMSHGPLHESLPLPGRVPRPTINVPVHCLGLIQPAILRLHGMDNVYWKQQRAAAHCPSPVGGRPAVRYSGFQVHSRADNRTRQTYRTGRLPPGALPHPTHPHLNHLPGNNFIIYRLAHLPSKEISPSLPGRRNQDIYKNNGFIERNRKCKHLATSSRHCVPCHCHANST